MNGVNWQKESAALARGLSAARAAHAARDRRRRDAAATAQARGAANTKRRDTQRQAADDEFWAVAAQVKAGRDLVTPLGLGDGAPTAAPPALPTTDEKGLRLTRQAAEKAVAGIEAGLAELQALDLRRQWIRLAIGAAVVIVAVIITVLVLNRQAKQREAEAAATATAAAQNAQATATAEAAVLFAQQRRQIQEGVRTVINPGGVRATQFLIPEGDFILPDDPGIGSNAIQTISGLPAFWIDRTEVTNRQYRACVEAGYCERPLDIDSSRRSGYLMDEEFDQYPVVQVSWDDARTYCGWVGGRLPAVLEWQKAARGTEGGKFPWGNTPATCDRVNMDGCVGDPEDTVAVGSTPGDASPYGVMDMAGNVSEWADSGEEYKPVLGGNFKWDESHFEVDFLSTEYPQTNYHGSTLYELGFRCAADVADLN